MDNPFVKYISTLLLLMAATLLYAEEETGVIYVEEEEMVELEELEVVSLKESEPLDEMPLSANAFPMTKLETQPLSSPKDVASFVPNFHMPDYGSQITSSIYVRGFGARIEQPVVGMVVDNVPILNKNCFDMDLFDMQRMAFLRGPQGTLYGRNTMCGLINLFTLSPFSYQGTRFSADYSKGNTLKLKASTYHKLSEKFAFSVAVNGQHTNGLFKNGYDESWCDPSNSISLRSRQMWRPKQDFSFENILSFSLLKQGGWAYALYSDSTENPVNYNDECHYHRTTFSDAFVWDKRWGKYRFSSVASYQYLNDDMLLDQDFLPESIFNLNQKQREHAVTEELVFQTDKARNTKRWNWKSGLYGFYKNNNMEAPVKFLRGGIEQLILDNANKGIQSVLPGERLDIQEDYFLVSSVFELPNWGVAAYHQSEFRMGKWNFTLGLRVDYEHAAISYRNRSELNYLFTLFMDDYKKIVSELDGEAEKSFFNLLPKVAVRYDLDKNIHLYAYAAKGFKAGGFNTQIFSDILQNALMNDMMSDMGMRFDGMGVANYDASKAISYDPEYNWTYELGGHFGFLENRLTTDVSLFYIDARNQQLTVFPAGKSTGRMMANAGKSRSFGAEFSSNYRVKNWDFSGSYGYTNAKFVDFFDGNNRYDGNYVPYSPMHSAALQAQYTFYVNRKCLDRIAVAADWKGTGKIYWDEENRYEQPFYSLFDASVSFHKKRFSVKGWCQNIGGNRYDTFSFVSMGNRFCQKGKPRRFGISLSYEFK